MRTLPRQELRAPPLRLEIREVVSGAVSGSPDLAAGSANAGQRYTLASRLLLTPRVCPAHERHVRRPGWTELFFDLVFAAAIAQLSAPLGHDYSLYGIGRFALLLALVFLAWFGYTAFSTQFAVDDVVERVLIVAQVFLVAVMAANATEALGSRDAAGFGAAYGGVRAILALQYARVASLSGFRPLIKRRISGLCVAVALWVFAALLPVPYRYAGWSIALLIDVANSWPTSRSTTASPPGATHFPERFGLLTIILLGEFVASVMRGIESQMGWSFLAGSAAVLSLGMGFAIWSCYSDGAMGWETRHVRNNNDVVRLRIWIAFHFALFLGIGVLGVGLRRAIALPPGAHFSAAEQWITCTATAGIILVIMGIALTSEHHYCSRRTWVWVAQVVVVVCVLALSPLYSQIIATALLAILFFCIITQTTLLVTNRRYAK
jgi:low temperature requirement protein LtrA